MKKLAIILLGLFPLVLSSCLKEEEDYFDKSASARIEEAVKNAISVLEGAENGWAVKYYPNPTQTFGGFNLFFKFDDGTVTVSSEIESASTTATSLYSVGQEAGPTLAIDTKNELINYFAHPRNPDGYGSNYKGLEGDYLWTVLSATPEKVMLRGVKSGSLYTLTPLETSDWASEMQAYKNAASDMEFPSYVCVVKGDSLECITTSEGKFLYRNLTIRQETDKGIESYAALYEKDAAELREAEAVARADMGRKQYAKMVEALDALAGLRGELADARADAERVRRAYESRLRKASAAACNAEQAAVARCENLLRESVGLIEEGRSLLLRNAAVHDALVSTHD